ncbi:MAG: type protein [Paenibacillaceae bacterium]|jgi:hypothetical protein|nr:type protein [Paenibacillaceae bacterium]
MKRSLRGILAAFLAIIVMAVSILPVAQASDSSSTSGETVLFSDDFETGYTIGDEPRSVTGDKGIENWSRIVKSATAGVLINEEASGNKFMKYFNNHATTSAGPRTEKTLDLTNVHVLSLQYRIKTFNQQSNLLLSGGTSLLKLSNGNVTVAGTVVEETYYSKDSWTNVSISLNMDNETYSVLLNGQLIREHAPLVSSVGDVSAVVFQFGSSIGAGREMHLDDVVFSLMETETVPEPDKHVLFSENFDSGYMPGDLPRSQSGSTDPTNWSLVVKSATATVTVAQDTENPSNQVALYANSHATASAGPRLEKRLAAWGIGKLEIKYRVKTAGERHELVLMQGTELHTSLLRLQGAAIQMAGTPVPDTQFPYAQWADILISLDLAQATFSVAINGSIVQENIALTGGIVDPSNITLRFGSYLGPSKQSMLDDVLVLTPDTVAEAPDYLDTLNTAVEHPVIPSIRQQHPRLMVTDFDAYRDKILQNATVGEWYHDVKKLADYYLNLPVYPYVTQTGNHILPLSRNILHVVYTLAFVYNIEGDSVYRDRLWDELENAAAFPSWHPNSFLSTAEMTHAFAIAYDWLYHDFTAEQKEILLNAMLKKGIEPAARSYNGERISETDFVTTTNNWNLVCNSSQMIAAIAIADEKPEIAEFLMDRASKAIQSGLGEYTADGAYPEGAMYWTYGTNYLTYGMASLESAFPDPSALPERLRLSLTPGLPQTGQFPIYLGVGPRLFNYGDSMIDNEGTPILYWHANTYGKPEYISHQLRHDLEPASDPWDLASWKKVLSILWYESEAPLPEDMPLDKSYVSEDNLNAVLLRSSWYDPDFIYTGLQGGFNSGSHMFLSIGNFVLDALGERWATMRGQGTYSLPGYFDKNVGRWNYYNTRAEGQNTLVINPDSGPDQNRLAVGRTLAFGSTEQEAFGIMDMTEAYAEHVDSAKRGIRLYDNRTKVMIQDEIAAKAPIDSGWWFMHTTADVAIQEDGKAAMLTIGDKRMWARIAAGPENAVFAVMDAKPLPQSPNPSAQAASFGQKLAIRFSGEQNVKLSVVFVPLKPYEAPPEDNVDVTDLSEWSITDSQSSGMTPPAPTEELSRGELARGMGDAVALLAESPFVYYQNKVKVADSMNSAATPIVDGGQWLIPADLLQQFLGVRVGKKADNMIAVEKGGKTIEFTLGSSVALVDGQLMPLQASPYALNDDTAMIPVSETVQALDLHLRALNERVLLIDRIPISRQVWDAEGQSSAIVRILERQLVINGEPAGFFDRDRYGYDLLLAPGEENPDVHMVLLEEGAVAQNGGDPENSDDWHITVQKPGSTSEEYLLQFKEDPWPLRAERMLVSVKVSDAAYGSASSPEVPTWIPVKGISSSLRNTNGNVEENTLDNDLSTRWSTEGEQWLLYDLGSAMNIYSMSLAIYDGSTRTAYFDLEGSINGVNWAPIGAARQTSGSGDWPDIFELGNVTARYIRIHAHGNSINKWNSYAEVKFYKDEAQEAEDRSQWSTYYGAVAPSVYTSGSLVQLQLLGYNKVKGRVSLNDATVSFSSDNEQIATVSNEGLVTLKNAGLVTITCRVEGGNSIRTAQISFQIE